METAEELAVKAHAARPNVIYQAARDGASVAAWHDGRWVPVAGKGIDGVWYSVKFELLIDGKPAFPQGLYGAAPEAH